MSPQPVPNQLPYSRGKAARRSFHGCLFASWLILFAATAIAGTDPSPPAKQEQQVAKLIAQLGSGDFQERERAAEALVTIGPPALEPLRRAAAGKDAEVRSRAERLVHRIENSLEQLLLDYRALGLPLPPENAPLARLERSRCDGSGKEPPPRHYLVVLIRPEAAPARAQVLWGTSMYEVPVASTREYWREKVSVIDAAAIQVKGMEKLLDETISDARDDRALTLALQCKARGWDRLAQAVFQRAFPRNDGETARTTLLSMAWDFWEARLSEPDSDWAAIAPRFKKLLTLDKKLDTEYNRLLLHHLEAALVPSKAKPGSVAAMIDDLIQVPGVGGPFFQDQPDPRYVRLLELGFAAVPDLIEHVDDIRLTRSRFIGFNNFRPYQLRVAHVVSELLEGLAGEYMGSGWAARGDPIKKTDALSWWEKARKLGEEKHLLAHVFPDKVEAKWPNDHVLYLIAKKYPQHLPKVYRTLLEEHPQLVSWWVVQAIVDSPLLRATKRETILRGARDKDLEHRWEALRELRKLDPEEFKAILIATLEGLPAMPPAEATDRAAETFAGLVADSEDPQLWQVLEKVAKHSGVRTRVQILERMNRDGRRKPMVAFLVAFLDDTTVYASPNGKLVLRNPEVRNIAALQMAEILEMSAEPKADWSPEQWAKWRDQVRRAVKSK